MADKVIYAMYDDDDVLLDGAKSVVSKGVHVRTVYSPFPIHGLDPIIGIKKTRLAICSFMYGTIGLLLALIGMWYFMVYDWPMNIGGKPNFSLWDNIPAFIPITFEFTVLLAAHGMAVTFLLRNGTLPGSKAKNPYPSTTDNRFVMEIRPEENHVETGEILNILQSTGAIQVDEKEINK